GPGCVASGSLKIYEALVAELTKRGLHTTIDCLLEREQETEEITTVNSGCQGFCEKGPLLRLEPSGVLYTEVRVEHVGEIVDALENNTFVEHLFYRDPHTNQPIAKEKDIPFYKYQTRVALANCGVIDPEDIRAYIAQGGYV